MVTMKLDNRMARLLCATILAGTVTAPVFAQQTAAGAIADEETIIVTGSRIARPDLESASPVQTLNQVDIQQSGVTNIQELLLKNPAFGTPALGRTNSAFLTSGTGVTTVDLRDLGTDRTLILINGRRVVAGVPGSSIVDLNVIPTQFIQRVDILTGGASSIYGSDAVAGVVNFIYKDDFQGIEAQAQYNITARGDDPAYQANLTMGGNFEDNRGNIMVHVGYSRQEGLNSNQRGNTVLDDIDGMQLSGDPADYGTSVSPFLSSFPSQGRFITGSGGGSRAWTYGPDGALRPCFSSNGGPAPAACGLPAGTQIGPDGFNRQAYRTIAVPVERYLFAARGHYEYVDNHRVVFEGTYSKTSSSRIIEPFALESGGNNGVFPRSSMPIESMVNGVLQVNPLVPTAIVNAATDTNGDGLRDIGWARRLNEFGTRNGSTNRDFFRFVVGLDGNFGKDNSWRYDVNYNYGRTTESQISNGQVNTLNFRQALNVISDPVSGAPICADPLARAQGCVPVNIFGAGAISPEAVRYIAADQNFQTDIQQSVFTAGVSGELFQLPGGAAGIAFGYEYRREASKENNDALTNAGLNAGNAIGDTSGSFNVSEFYGELNLPLLANVPGAHLLNLNLSGRASNYSTVGKVYSYAASVEWAPIEDVKFRGTYSRSVRAPNIGELYQGPAQTFPAGLVDPCVGIGLTGGGVTGDACRAAPGVLANIAANGVFTLNQSDIQGVSGFNIGNPDLEEEKAKSYTLGVVINPRSVHALRNFSLTVDYFNIDVDNAIVATPRPFILAQCYQGGDTSFCDLIERRPEATAINSAGSIDLIDSQAQNAGQLKTEGVDVGLNWHMPVGDGGRVSARVAYTHYFAGYVIPADGADKDVYVGEIGNSKDRFTANLGWSNSDLDIIFTGTYMGPVSEDDQFLAAFDLEPGAVRIGAEFYLDFQAAAKITDNFEAYFGIDNLLDNGAPNILSGSFFNTTGTDTAADVYDVFGRRFYTGVRMKF